MLFLIKFKVFFNLCRLKRYYLQKNIVMSKDNLVEFIENSIKKNWIYNALSDYRGETLSFEKVAERIIKLHIIFEEGGIKEGEKIALVGKNSTNWAITYLAIISYGAVVVPVLPDFKPSDIHHITNHSDSILLFCSNSIFESLEESRMPMLRAVFSLNDFSLISQKVDKKIQKAKGKVNTLLNNQYPKGISPQTIKFKHISNQKLAVISYTSGTTGFTKGVMIPHLSLLSNVVYANKNMPLEPGDSIVSFLPLAHAYGCAFEFLWPFTLGCHITFLTKTPSPQVILEAFKQVRPRLVLAVPLIMEKIYKKQILPVLSKAGIKVMTKVPIIQDILFSKIKNKLIDSFGGNFHEVVIGGAALNAEVETFLRRIQFPFSIGYGMTECGPLISYANWDKTRHGSAGRIVDKLEIRIDSSDPYAEVGEILVRGDHVMSGYYKNEQATNDAIDQSGWLHTGDLGLIDKENFVYIRGRCKTMVLGPSGQNIYPEEIEAKLNNLEYVLESLVLEKDNKLIALIYPDHESADKNKISGNQLIEIMENHKKNLNNELPSYMKLAGVKIYPEEFEKTPKKSIKRFLYTLND